MFLISKEIASLQLERENEADDARLVLISMQRNLGLSTKQLLPAQALLQAAVEMPGHAEDAFQVLAAMGGEFRQMNRYSPPLWSLLMALAIPLFVRLLQRGGTVAGHCGKQH